MLERTEVCHRAGSNDDGASMDAELPDSSLKFLGIRDEFMVKGITIYRSFEIEIFLDRIFDGNAWSCWNQFCELIHLSEGDA